MSRYIITRLLLLVPILLGVSIVIFILVRLVPGDVARIYAGLDATDEQVAAIRHQLGLDKPLVVQYLIYLNAVLHGDLGRSVYSRAPVVMEVMARYPATVQLAVTSMCLAVTLGLFLGIIAAIRRNTILDNLCSIVSVTGISMPAFWFGLMLMLVFCEQLRWFPSAGAGSWKNLVLPAITLSTYTTAIVARMTRATLIDVLGQEFIRTARAKGLRERLVVYRHALKNALIPVVTMVGLQVGFLLGGAVIVETVFAYPGLGRLMVDSIKNRDFPIVQGGVLLMATTFVLVNLVVDLLYAYLDPRIRYR
ncbi:MAG: ABC transporter permease [Chloroflexi bacterium]|nr:ABC transporter permease [Chloroflexota bacterium]MCL5076182.1 ABC transporter permease [Chloroflexota bacterium]